MLVRIVRMTFHKDKVEKFLSVFEETKQNIRGFEGCLHLELLEDYNLPNVFMTYSHWVDEHALDTYRHSKVFKNVWAQTKPLFSDKPVAFSSKQRSMTE